MDAEAYARQLQDAYDNEAPLPSESIDVPDLFWYVHFKAFVFLRVGPDEYRAHDALSLPPADLPATRLDAISRGCEQILQFRGLGPDRPLEGIGVAGFYALLQLFHFRCAQQAAMVTPAADVFLDEMVMRHFVDGGELTLYNQVRAGGFPEADTPCPYCGEPLRTALAKQCRHCGMDWHNLANVVCRRKGLAESS